MLNWFKGYQKGWGDSRKVVAIIFIYYKIYRVRVLSDKLLHPYSVILIQEIMGSAAKKQDHF
jgi:hypothetical protein